MDCTKGPDKSLWDKIRIVIILGAMASITGFVFTTWLDAPWGGDKANFFAAARQADYHGSFPFNVYESWEVKPLGHRVVIYGIYKAAKRVSDYSNKPGFEKATKVVYAAAVLLITAVVLFGTRRWLKDNNIPILWVFFAVALVFLSVSWRITLQAEELSLLFILIALPLAMAKSKALNLLSGLPLAALFTLKGVTILLALYVPIILYALGPEYRQQLRWCVVGLVAWSILTMAVLASIFPQELRDLRNATLIQDSFDFQAKNFGNVFWVFTHKLQLSPVFAPVVILAWISLPVLAWHKDWTKISAFLAMAAVGGTVVFLQGSFLGYHFAVFIVPTVWLLLVLRTGSWDLAAQLNPNKIAFLAVWSLGLIGLLAMIVYVDRQTTDVVPFGTIGFNLAALSVGFTILLTWLTIRSRLALALGWHSLVLTCFVLVFAGAFWIRFQSPWSPDPAQYRRSESVQVAYDNYDARYRFSEQTALLYFSGTYAYQYGAPSHCRYFNMEVLKHLDGPGGEKMKDSSVFRDTLECALSYDGNYILGDVNPAQLPELSAKIDKEYQLIPPLDPEFNFPFYQKRQPLTD